MINIEIAGKIQSAEKVYHFKTELIKLKIGICLKQGREMSSIVYVPYQDNTSLLRLRGGKFIHLTGTAQIKPHYIKKDHVKEFLVFFAENWKILKRPKYANKIYFSGLVESIQTQEVLSDVAFSKFTVKVRVSKRKRRLINCSCRGTEIVKVTNNGIGGEVHIEGFFKSVRHHILINSKDFEFDTIEVSTLHIRMN